MREGKVRRDRSGDLRRRQEFHLSRLAEIMSSHGVNRLYVKKLSPNDNSKNQVYFGPGFEAINIIPNKGVHTEQALTRIILKAAVDMAWTDEDGALHNAPETKMILYPQYPEVRMSGFLKGCRQAPSEIMASRDTGRVLFLGIRNDGKVIAYATSAGTAVVRELDALGELPAAGVFFEITIGAGGERVAAREALISQLRRIHLLDWVNSNRLRLDGSFVPCNASNCGGYTLEAELGITPNGFSEPDYMGWEVKQHGVPNFNRPGRGSPVTLMTPEPTGGYYKDAGVEAFIRRFGYPDTLGRPDRLNIGGIFRAGTRAPRTGLTLVLDGYNAEKNMIVDISKGITLLTDDDEVAAVWNYAGLIDHWKRKHDRAAYIPSECRTDPQRQYRYGRMVNLGERTDFLLLLVALAKGDVYYDPGIKLEQASGTRPQVKRRSQFRVKWEKLGTLYRSMETLDVLSL